MDQAEFNAMLDRHYGIEAPPTPEERAEGIRHAALHNAVTVVGCFQDPRQVIDAARAFEAYLRGETAS